MDGELFSLVGIFSENRPEFVITELACIRDSIAVVPIYSNAAPSMVQGVLQQTEIATVFVSGYTCETIISVLGRGGHSNLRLIVSFDAVKED